MGSPVRTALFKRIARTACAIIFGAVICCAGIQAQDAPQSGRAEPSQPRTADAFATRITLQGVPGLQQVAPNLYRGEQPTTEGYENLAKMGIQIVVDMRLSGIGYDRKRVSALGMRFVSIPWFCMFPQDKIFAEFLQLVRDNPGKKIYLHCRLGDDRAGITIAAYRIAEQGWTAEKARKEMIESGADWLHRRLCPTLASYERKFPDHFQTKPIFAKLRNAGPLPEPPASSPAHAPSPSETVTENTPAK